MLHHSTSRPKTIFRLSIASAVGLVALTYSMSTHALNSDEALPPVPTGSGTIIIDQENASGDKTLGEWTLIKPGNEQEMGRQPSQSFTDFAAGNYTILVNSPHGASAAIRLYRNGALESFVQRPQTSFNMVDKDTIRIAVNYAMTRVGTVGVDTEPSGIDFRLVGPNSVIIKGTTPASYLNMPEGQYKVDYMPPNGCVQPPSKGLLLQANSRVSFTIKLSCAALDKIRKKQTDRASQGNALSVTKDGKSTVFYDVPTDAWFAPYASTTARLDILSGYKDAGGNATGSFGPANNVTVAELAKIAHKLAGVSEDSFTSTTPINLKAPQGVWFSPFIASAEQRGWTIYASGDIDPARPATRGEVLQTLYQALDVPLQWQKGNVFSDVSARFPYSAAIETAAAESIVQGRSNADGTVSALFGPSDPVNRAEMAKILTKLLETYRHLSEK